MGLIKWIKTFINTSDNNIEPTKPRRLLLTIWLSSGKSIKFRSKNEDGFPDFETWWANDTGNDVFEFDLTDRLSSVSRRHITNWEITLVSN
jgi:hypothetical protein